MVAAVRRGAGLREVARTFRVSLLTVQRWVQRAAGKRLDRVDWSDRPPTPQTSPTRTARALEDLVLTIRRELREQSDLGEWGAAAIQRELQTRELATVPSLLTINRILARRSAVDAQHRVRHKPPPRGWSLPDVAAGAAELDQFDAVEGLRIKDGPEVEAFTTTSLHGGLIDAWPSAGVSAASTRTCLVAHWRAVGLPSYAQFDNDTRFQGPHQHPDVIGSVMRLYLSLGLVPVFAPPRESGFQAAIESLNGRWQAKVWARFPHESLEALQRSRPSTSRPAVPATRCGSRAHRPDVPFPRTGGSIGKRIPMDASSSCAGRPTVGPCNCLDTRLWSTHCGHIGWCDARSTWMTSGSGFIGCGDVRRMTSRWWVKYPMCCPDVASEND